MRLACASAGKMKMAPSAQDPLELTKLFMTAEMVMFVIDGGNIEKGIDEMGIRSLKLFKAIGVTSFVTVIQNLDSKCSKRDSAIRNLIPKRISAEVRSLDVFNPHELRQNSAT